LAKLDTYTSIISVLNGTMGCWQVLGGENWTLIGVL
jgi:hypothetical protein